MEKKQLKKKRALRLHNQLYLGSLNFSNLFKNMGYYNIIKNVYLAATMC